MGGEGDERLPFTLVKTTIMEKYLIIGNGIAGVTAARSIVRATPNAEVHVLGSEPYPFYPRPRLWELIAGEITQDEIYFHPLKWYREQGIQIHTNTVVTAIDPEKHSLSLAGGGEFSFNKLLLATGARSFIPPIEGVHKPGVFALRTLNDALAIKEHAATCSGAVVIGGGLLGLETARALRSAGLDVTVIEFLPYLMPRQLDAEGGAVLQSLLEAQGMHILPNSHTEAILGEKGASGVRLKDGPTVKGELVLVSTGVRPRVKLAQEAGLAVNRGVVVDKYLQSSAEDVYAAGDVAEFEGRLYGIIPPSIEQARIAAANMVAPGSSTYQGSLPSTTLKITGIDLTSLGEATASGDEYTLLRAEDSPKGVYRRLTLRDGKIVGAIFLGTTLGVRAVKKLIAAKRDVFSHQQHLLDKDFDLSSI